MRTNPTTLIQSKFTKIIVNLLVYLLLFGTFALADRRVALVIGNSTYEHVQPLPNPTNDVDKISAALTNIGFEVSIAKNVDYQTMRLALREFSNTSIGSDIALVYFAGHGIEIDRNNYLIPTDARLRKDIDVEFEAFSLDQFNSAVSGAKGLKIILLDACRENPFAKSMKRTSSTRSVGRGLASVEPTGGTLISFAAKEGTVASDGDNSNSPYTSALVKYLSEPGLEIQLVFRKVRDSVLEETNGQQEPFYYASLPGKEIFLSGSKSKAPVNQSQPVAESTGNIAEVAFWNSIQTTNDLKLFELYINKFPNGLFVEIAKAKIFALIEPKKPEKEIKEIEVATLPFFKNIHSRSSSVHLGDENIKKWAKLSGQCYTVKIPAIENYSSIKLSYQGFGVEAATLRFAGKKRKLRIQPNKKGKKRPNYWSGTQSLYLALPSNFKGDRFSICSENVKNPEFNGDKDDLMLRNISLKFER